MSCQIVVLGAGISGLATAWYLKHYLGSDASVQVIEKSARPGGWVQTLQTEGFLFEQGPRSCRSKGAGQETLALIENLGLQDQVLVPHADATHRYLYDHGNLKRMPRHLWGIPFNPLTKGWLQAFWNDWRMPKRTGRMRASTPFSPAASEGVGRIPSLILLWWVSTPAIAGICP